MKKDISVQNLKLAKPKHPAQIDPEQRMMDRKFRGLGK